MDMKELSIPAKLVFLALASVTLIVTPFFSYDPINVPRFFFLTIFGIASLFVVALNLKSIALSSHRTLLYLTLMFMVWEVLSLFFSKINLTEGLFGVTGRQTGFLTYISFAALIIVSSIASNSNLITRVANLLIFCGSVSAFYGLIQVLDLDPFNWTNPYSPVFGIFGNPNFHASFMGISATAALAKTLQNLSLRSKILNLLFVATAVFNIYKSGSQQGYLVLLSGAVIVFYLFISVKLNSGYMTRFYVLITAIGFMAVLLDILQKAPWPSALYKDSVTFRGDFWRAGINMTIQYPVFGVGPDGYRDAYRGSRDITTALRPGSDVSTDSAHNVFLDLSSNGGVPLLGIYTLILIYALISAVRIIKKLDTFNFGVIAILASWVAYLAQSIISINQIGLAVWGWVLPGLIIGYEINTRTPNAVVVKFKSKSHFSVPAASGVVIGVIIALPLFIADTSFRSTIKSGDVLKIEAAINQWPQSVIRMTTVARLFREANLTDRSVVIARDGVRFNPNNYEAWRELILQPAASPEERDNAFKKMKELDPYNPNLKQIK
jgi:O-antigen ligase